MAVINDEAIVFGLTGAFGSGCTALADGLVQERRFVGLKLSDLIRRDLDRRAQARGEQAAPQRGDYQDLGDARRRFHGTNAYWAQEAIRTLEKDAVEHHRVVLDGLRHPEELRWLRERFKNCLIVAVDAPWAKRWDRLRTDPAWRNRSQAEFDAVSRRDIDSPQDWGQHVQACIDACDYVVDNDDDRGPKAAVDHLVGEADRLLALLSGDQPDDRTRPRDDEIFMHMAQAGASRSACLKRQVGALIVSPATGGSTTGDTRTDHVAGKVLGLGYNENADHLLPCYREFGECYRDTWRRQRLAEMDRASCPTCGSELQPDTYPPICSNRGCPDRTSLLNVIFPERAMSHCTAIHAEVRAILTAGTSDLRGTTLYSTTFPCFLCAQQVINAGIATVVYVEAYPDKAAAELLDRAGVTCLRFSGVRSGAYERLFRGWREAAERRASRSSTSR